MFIKIIAIGLGVLACALAEAPLQQHRQRSGPYAPSGWRPRKPFNLPGEYLPPTSEFEAQQEQRPQQVEVTKERVDFVGQSQGSAFAGSANEPQDAYLPPDNQDPVEFPRTQALPVEGRFPVFNRDRTQFQARPHGGFTNQQRKPVRQGPNGQRDFPTTQRKPHQKYQPAEEPVEQPQVFQPQEAQFFQPQRQQPQTFQPQQQSFQPQQQSFQPQQQSFQPQQQSFQPQQQSFKPQQQSFQPQQQTKQPQQQSFQPQQQSFQPQQQSFQPQNQQFFPDQPRPAQQYGAPFTGDQYPEPRNSQDVKYEFQASEQEEEAAETDEFEQQKQSETDNVDNDEYRSNGPPAKATKGQYYIVGPDNSIQRVVFTTKEDLDENGRAAGNGAFTAQLKYSPAGAVKDPIYRYNNRGQLVRVVKK